MIRHFDPCSFPPCPFHSTLKAVESYEFQITEPRTHNNLIQLRVLPMVGVKPLIGWLTGAMFLAVAAFQLSTLINPREIEILKTSFSEMTVVSAVKCERVQVVPRQCCGLKQEPSRLDSTIKSRRYFTQQKLHSNARIAKFCKLSVVFFF